jgi:phosphatidylglycerophosphatase A
MNAALQPSPRPSVWWITVFGLGHMRPFPGTWGSIPTVLVAGLLVSLGAGPDHHPVIYNLLMLLVAIVFTAGCIAQGSHAEAIFLKKDPSPAVADETAGQAIALLFLPVAGLATPLRAVLTLLAAFVLFRVMDILKPFPAYQMQKFPAGWGIVLDDLLAGVYALAALQLGVYFLFK